jgi:DNA-binding transcriptional regulator YhcF (GntR family)
MKTSKGKPVRPLLKKGLRHRHDQPAYRRIFEELRALILAQEFPAGSFLPSEAKMAAIYETNKCTLRQALSLLREEGMVQTIPSRGWEVIAHQPAKAKVKAKVAQTVLMLGPAANSTALTLQAAKRTLIKAGVKAECELLPVVNLQQWLTGQPDHLPDVGAVVVFCDARLPESFVARVASRGLPLVCAALQQQAAEYDTVATDNGWSSAILLDHLVRQGSRRILYVTNPNIVNRLPSFHARHVGFIEGVRRRELMVEEVFLPVNSLELPDCEKIFLSAMDRLAAAGTLPDALVFSSDNLAFCAVSILRRHGLDPEQFQLATYGMNQTAEMFAHIGYARPIPYVEESWAEIGTIAAEMALARMNGAVSLPRLTLVKSFLVDLHRQDELDCQEKKG